MATEVKDEHEIRTPVPNPHIWLDSKGVAWIGKTNMKVIELATDKLAHENGEMHRQYPHVSMAQIHAGLAYYYDHQAEFDAKIVEQYQDYLHRWEENKDSPLHQKLRAEAQAMSVNLYMDVNVRYAVTQGLRRRGVDVLTAQEDGRAELPDPELLDRATALGRALFTHDADFLAEAGLRQGAGRLFAGVIYVHQRELSIGECVHDLEPIALASEPAELANKTTYLPL